LLTTAVAGIAALLIMGLAGSATASGLANSGHDFSINTRGQAETCVVCHASSDTQARATNILAFKPAPRLFGGADAVATGGADHGSLGLASFADDRANSRPCLGCHDGSVAPDNLLHSSGDLGGISSSLFGMDSVIGRGHPVFVIYDGMVARRKGLFDPAITPSGLGGTISEDLLVDSQLVCSSCHGVHDQSGRGDFLRISNERSRLCLTCHDL